MKAYRIKITDNETGEVLLCDNFDAIIGAGASSGEDEVRGFTYTHCDTMSLISAVCAVRSVAHEATEDLQRKLRRKVRRFDPAKSIKNQNKKQKGE